MSDRSRQNFPPRLTWLLLFFFSKKDLPSTRLFTWLHNCWRGDLWCSSWAPFGLSAGQQLLNRAPIYRGSLKSFLHMRTHSPALIFSKLFSPLLSRLLHFLQLLLLYPRDKVQKPIVPVDRYRAIRDSQLIGLSGYSNEDLPVFAVGVGLSTLDKASVHYYVQSHIQMNEYRDRVILPAVTKKRGKLVSKCIKILDMTGLKLSSLNQIKLVTLISSIDDLNYPEKTQTYYIVNSPYVFSACWKIVKPLLHERTQRKINVLSGCGQEELLKIMDYSSLPYFCRKRSYGSSNYSSDNCYSLDHPFHQLLYNYINQQAVIREPVRPIKHGSVHVTVPENADDEDIAKTLESELEKFKNLERCHE